MAGIEVHLERKQHEHVRHKLFELRDPSAAPGPDLRADVPDDRNLPSPELTRQTQVEIGKVNQNGTELEFVIMVIAVSCVKLLSAHNSTQHTSRKHKV
jgi:hypothetical protein